MKKFNNIRFNNVLMDQDDSSQSMNESLSADEEAVEISKNQAVAHKATFGKESSPDSSKSSDSEQS